MDAASALLFIILSLLLSAFFSGIEIAFISANKLRIAINSKQQGGVIWKTISRYQENPAGFISTTLVGNNIALVVYGIAMSVILDEPFEQFIPNEYLSLILTTVISTLIVLVTAELLPKVLFRINPIGMLKALIIPFRIFHFLFLPLVGITVLISNSAIRLITGKKVEKNLQIFTPLDLNQIVGDDTHVELDEEKSMDTEIFKNAIDFKSLKVRDCMTPRTEIVAMDVTDGLEGLYKIFAESGHSKIPVYNDSIDNIVGYVHQAAMFNNPEDLNSILLPMIITNESHQVAELMKELISENKSMALVVDEFGGTAGIITIEDIMEEILGEIEDEYDKEELKETIVKENHYILSARHEIEYLNKEFGLEIEEGDYDTLGGFIISHSDNIPNKGEIIFTEKFEIKILKVENGRIDEVELKVL